MKNLILLFVLALGAVPAFYGQSASDTYQIGGTVVRVPAPEGFVEISKTFETVGARMRATEGGTNELLAVYVPKTFLPRLRETQDIDLEFYAKLSVNQAAKNLDATKTIFDGIVASLEKNFDTYLDPNGPLMKRLETTSEKNLSALLGTDPNLKFTGMKPLGFFEKSDRVFSGIMVIDLEIYGRKVSTLGTISVVNVGKRLIFVATYKMFPTAVDVPVLRDFAKKWTTAIAAANK